MRIILFIFFLNISLGICGENPKDSICVDTLVYQPLSGSHLTYPIIIVKTRSENISKYCGALCSSISSDKCELSIKESGGEAYIKDGHSWVKFIDNGKLLGVEILTIGRLVKAESIIRVDNRTYFIFSLKEINIANNTNFTKYIYTLGEGIVAIQNEMTSYITDEFNIPVEVIRHSSSPADE